MRSLQDLVLASQKPCVTGGGLPVARAPKEEKSNIVFGRLQKTSFVANPIREKNQSKNARARLEPTFELTRAFGAR
jgi:hypothetical protein